MGTPLIPMRSIRQLFNNGNGVPTRSPSKWPLDGGPWAVMYISPSIIEGQWHIITPLTRVAFVYNCPKGMELAPNPHILSRTSTPSKASSDLLPDLSSRITVVSLVYQGHLEFPFGNSREFLHIASLIFFSLGICTLQSIGSGLFSRNTPVSNE